MYMQILVAMGIQWGMACLSVQYTCIGAGGVRKAGTYIKVLSKMKGTKVLTLGAGR